MSSFVAPKVSNDSRRNMKMAYANMRPNITGKIQSEETYINWCNVLIDFFPENALGFEIFSEFVDLGYRSFDGPDIHTTKMLLMASIILLMVYCRKKIYLKIIYLALFWVLMR